MEMSFFVEVDDVGEDDSQVACHAMEIGRLPGSSRRLASSPTAWHKEHI